MVDGGKKENGKGESKDDKKKKETGKKEAEILQKAQEIQQKKLQERVQKCSDEVAAILKKHNCTLDISMTISQRGNQPNVQIIPIQEKK